MAVDTPARIAILGAGPIGLEAAIYARYLGYDVDVYERGQVAENVLAWGHATMFTPFGGNRSPLGLAALKAQDANWSPPSDEAHLTGQQFAEQYLLPLAASDLFADCVHPYTEVVAVGRDGPLKEELAGDPERGEADFRLLLRAARPQDHGRERIATADVVIDCTGTHGNHNWMGRGGIPAIGELVAAPHVEYALCDVLGTARQRYAGRRTLLVGAGHTAASNLVALAELAGQVPDTWITWIVRQPCDASEPRPVRLVADDPLPLRDRMARQANRLAQGDANHVTLLGDTTVESITWHADLDRFTVRFTGGHDEQEFDRVIANVGYRPDMTLAGELQVSSWPVAQSLVQAEPHFYLLGAKSRGRDSNFLLSDGFEQIRQVFAILGDRAELDLYATMAGLY